MIGKDATHRVRGRKALAAVAVLAAGSMVLTACGDDKDSDTSASGTSAATGPIKVWTLQDAGMRKAWQGSVDTFNASSTAGKATMQVFANDPYKQKMRTSIGAPTGPDVFFNWGGGGLEEYIKAGKVRPLDDFFTQNPDVKSAFMDNILASAKGTDGKYYGVPMRGMQPVFLYYNKDVLAKAGVPEPQDGWTWTEFTDAVAKLKAKGLIPVSLAGSQPWCDLMWAEYLLDRIGGPEVFQKIRNGDKTAWADPSVTEAMTKVQELVNMGAFGAKYTSQAYDQGASSMLVAQGRAGFQLMGSWDIVTHVTNAPKFVKAGKLGWVGFPVIDGGKGDPSNVIGNPTNYYSVSAASKAPGTAEAYLKEMKSDKYIDDLIAAGDVPAINGVEAKLQAAPNSAHALYVYGLAQKAKSYQLSWDQDLGSAEATKMLTQLTKVFNKQITPEKFGQALSQ